jgi:hypothetical protein
MAERFAAFISYSHADAAAARWLHHRLETFRMPRALVGTETPFGPVARRLPPSFRDRDELPASGDQWLQPCDAFFPVFTRRYQHRGRNVDIVFSA